MWVIAGGANDLGELVGQAESCSGHLYAFRWSQSAGYAPLPTPAQTSESAASAINLRGTVVGYRSGTTNGVLHNPWPAVWMSGQFFEITPPAGPNSGGSMGGPTGGINDDNWIAGGFSSDIVTTGVENIGFVWHDGVRIDIDPRPYGRISSQCSAIANNGWVAGRFGRIAAKTAMAFRWHNEAIEVLRPLPGADLAEAHGCNSAGVTVGRSANGNRVNPTDGEIVELPTLWLRDGTPAALPLPNSFTNGECESISDTGLILGTVRRDGQGPYFAIWTLGRVCLLYDVIESVQGWAFGAPAGQLTPMGKLCGDSAQATNAILVPRYVPGDLNDDCAIDGQDIQLLLQQWGADQTTTTADFNLDGVVDGADLGILLGNWTGG